MTGRLALAIATLALLAAACDTTPHGSIGPGPGGTATVSGPSATPIGSDEPVASVAPVAIQKIPGCQLVFAAEAATAIGVPISEAQEQTVSQADGGWVVDCVYWGTIGYHDQAPMELTVATGSAAIEQFDALKGENGVTSRAGLGDEALLRTTTFAGLDGPIVSLFVRVGDAVLGVSLGIAGLTDDGVLTLAGDAAAQERIVDSVAAMALGRLTSAPVQGARTCDLLSLADASTIARVSLDSAADGDMHDVWGPTCTYTAASHPDLFVSVNGTAAAKAQFSSCSSGGDVVPGLGDAAAYGPPGRMDCTTDLDGVFFTDPLLVRAGDVIVTIAARPDGVTDTPQFQWHDRAEALARHVLAKLGVAPGPTSAPFAASSMEHPCALVSDVELAAIVGHSPASDTERAADQTGADARCIYWLETSVSTTLYLNLSHNAEALQAFADLKSDSRYTPAAGVGDEAFTLEIDGAADRPLLEMDLRQGGSVLQLSLGGIGTTSDGRLIAPGDLAAEMAMLRQLATLVLQRLATPG